MRRTPVIVLSVVAALLFVFAGVLYVLLQSASADSVRSKVAEAAAVNRYTDAANAIAEIQDSLNAIAVGDTKVGLLSRGLQAEQNLNAPEREKVLNRIAVLRVSIARTRLRIGELESNLKASGLRISGLERIISGLKRAVADREQRVDQLTERVDSLESTVSGLRVTVESDQTTIRSQEKNLEARRRELATIYYVLGTKRDLTTSGLVRPRGGALGIGKTLVLTGRFDESRFMPLDTDQETVIRIPSAKARILSSQPIDSYELRNVGGALELHILDASGFRKVKHLVIMTG